MKRFVLIICFLLATGFTFASDSDIERLSLKGLKGLRVVCHVQSNVQLPDLQETRLLQDIETKLQYEGIIIPFKVEYDKHPLDYGVLHVSVVVVYHEGADFYFYTNNLEILQYCVLSRNRDYETMMPTWTEGFSGGNRSVKEIRDKILDNLDTIIKAYLYVNRK